MELHLHTFVNSTQILTGYRIKKLVVETVYLGKQHIQMQTCACLHDGLQWTHSVEQTHQDTCQVTDQRGPKAQTTV